MTNDDRAERLVLLPQPRGFCAGVIRAIDTVRIALQTLGPPLYVRKEIVHNGHVVDQLALEGAVFVDEVDEAPVGATIVFSAHGVSPAVRAEAAARGLRVIDATCPLVAKVHLEAIRYVRDGYTVVLIGHADHDEVVGTFGEAPDAIQVISSPSDVDSVVAPDPSRVAYLTQTTLSLDDTHDVVMRLRQRFPALVGAPERDICYATQNRQAAVKVIAHRADVVLVVGAPNSSNSNRLVEVAARAGCRAHLIASADEVQPRWFDGCTRIGVTAGASTPDHLVNDVIDELRRLGCGAVEDLKIVDEQVEFSLPGELRDLAVAGTRKGSDGRDVA